MRDRAPLCITYIYYLGHVNSLRPGQVEVQSRDVGQQVSTERKKEGWVSRASECAASDSHIDANLPYVLRRERGHTTENTWFCTRICGICDNVRCLIN